MPKPNKQECVHMRVCGGKGGLGGGGHVATQPKSGCKRQNRPVQSLMRDRVTNLRASSLTLRCGAKQAMAHTRISMP